MTLTNTGTRPAPEIVQAYVSDLVTSVTWADQELKAYRHVDLEPGDRRRSSSSCRSPTARSSTADGRRSSSPATSNCSSDRRHAITDLLRANFRIHHPDNIPPMGGP